MGALRRRAPNKPTLATNNMNAHTATNPLESPVAGNVDCTVVAGAVVTGTAAVVTGTAAVVTGTAAVVVVTGADGGISFVIVNDRTTSVALV